MEEFEDRLAEFEQVTIQRKPKYRVHMMVIHPYHPENDWECWLTRSPYPDDDHDGYGEGPTMQAAVEAALESVKSKAVQPAS